MNVRSAMRVASFSLAAGFFGENTGMLTGNEDAKYIGLLAHLNAAVTAIEEDGGNSALVGYLSLSVVGSLLGEFIAYQADIFSTGYPERQLSRAVKL